MNNKLEIKFAQKDDVALILTFIKELAVYEKIPHEVEATEEQLSRTLFGNNSHAEVVLAYYDKIAAGFAIFFHNYSTFLAKPGLYLEDLYVKPEYRGKGIGTKIFGFLGSLAKDRGCGRLELSVLNWNKPAIDFYKSMGANAMDEWTVYRIAKKQLETLEY